MERISVEDALRALRLNLDMSGYSRGYFEAIIASTLPDFYYDVLWQKKHDYKDDLPDVGVRELIDLTQGRGTQYKCQGNFIVGLNLELAGTVEDGVVTDPELIGEIREFRAHDFRFHHGEFTTKEEVEMMNGILDKVLAHLEPMRQGQEE